jgi:uncharacterized DUF497 family protein
MNIFTSVSTNQAAILGRTIIPDDREMSEDMARFLIGIRLTDSQITKTNPLALLMLLDPMALVREDTETEGEQRFVAVGMDALGRILTVMYTYREPDTIRLISARPATKKERQAYEGEYNMTGATHATEVEYLNRLRSRKTRITIMLDNDMLEAFRARAEKQGMGYQTFINLALREYLSRRPVDEETLRRMLREELDAA